jgi:amino acid transporter
VLSAVEGLRTLPGASNAITETQIMLITIAIMVGLFAIQSRGTERVAALFGPVCILWFVAIGGLGLWHIADEPGILRALNPYYAVEFLATHGVLGLFVLGAVFLTVTGVEETAPASGVLAAGDVIQSVNDKPISDLKKLRTVLQATKAGETVIHNGVKVIGPVNVAGTLAYNASEMYARNLFNFLKPAIDKTGDLKIDWADEVFAGAVLTHDGAIKHEATRKAIEG